MRILYLVHSLDIGGTERLVVDLVQRFREEADVRVCCLDRLGVWGEELRCLGIPVTCLNRRPGFDFSVIWRLGRLLRGLQPLVLHCHQYPAFFYGACASLFSRQTKVLFTEHGRFHPDIVSFRRRLANRGLTRLADGITSVSHAVKQAMVAQEGIPAERIQVVYNGVRPERFAGAGEQRQAVRNSLHLEGGAFVIGTVGRLDPIKDHPMLLQAFARVHAQRGHARLLIIGEGGSREALEAQTRALGLQPAVQFLGSREDIPNRLAACDVFALSSLSEGMPVTILEAMAAGLPVVATAVGDNPCLVLDGVTGLLCPAGDPGAFSAALIRLLEQEPLRRQLGRDGRQRVLQNFTGDRIDRKSVV
jgi:sugar transferase (PEP-CTERM/EpsH1 system associated)